MSNDLEQYDEEYKNAETPTYGDVPEGVYQAWVERATIDRPEWAFHPQLSLQLRIIGGDWNNSCVFVAQSFDPEFIKYLKGAVAAMNLEPAVEYASEIRGRLNDMLDRVLEVKVVHKPSKKDPSKTFINTYVQRYVAMKDEALAEMSETQLDELGF